LGPVFDKRQDSYRVTASPGGRWRGIVIFGALQRLHTM
jgi:hypothetical protein